MGQIYVRSLKNPMVSSHFPIQNYSTKSDNYRFASSYTASWIQCNCIQIRSLLATFRCNPNVVIQWIGYHLLEVKMRSVALLFLFILLLTGCTIQNTPAATGTSPGSAPQSTSINLPTEENASILFDDFSYSARDEMTANGWVIRSQAGWPGIPGASFRPENVTFVDDVQGAANRLLRMTSSTGGTGGNTFQTQICHRRKYLEGTYAARVYFSNRPVAGADGDQVVETFYAITPYEGPLRPDYSEMDFEYLPNGGWGLRPMTIAFTTWETVRIEPWQADNASDSVSADMEGWQTLVLQAMDGRVRYFINGSPVGEHSGNYYPDARMSINFNLWFIDGGLIDSNEIRSYQEDIDWVFHAAGEVLSPRAVEQKIQSLREAGVKFLDAVPDGTPVLPSPCDL